MKTKIIVLIVAILFCFTSLSFADRDRGKGKKDRGKHYGQRYDGPKHHDDRRIHRRGYRSRHHIPDYHRHREWRRWGEWDRHYKRYPKRYPGGHYHHDRQGNLMFSFCQDSKDSSTCVSFGFYY